MLQCVRRPYCVIPKIVMWRCLLLYFSVCGVLLAGPEARAVDPADTILESYEQQRRDIAAKVEQGTVWVLVDSPRQFSSGSGFIVGPGHVMTNAHVVRGAGKKSTIYVMNAVLPKTRATVVATSYIKGRAGGDDFALLRFTPPPGSSLPVLSFNEDARRMDRVAAWGYPGMVTQFDKSIQDLHRGRNNFSVPPVVYTEGTISTLVQDSNTKAIIHTAALAGGNSGGPLVNRKGEVIGVNTWGYKSKNEGAFINASLTATSAMAFLRKNGVTPLTDPAGGGVAVASLPSPPSPAYTGQAAPDNRPAEPAAPAWRAPSGGGGPPSRESGNREADAAPRTQPGSGARAAGTGLETDARLRDASARAALSLAVKGDVPAMVSVGANYMGSDAAFPKDSLRAAYWLKKATDAGSPDALGLLGLLHLVDDDWYDPAKALILLKKSASLKGVDPRFQAMLAVLLVEGESRGVAPDYDESYMWAKKAADAGDASAKALLAFHYYMGKAVDKNAARALSLARETALAGNNKGKAVLAFIRYAERSGNKTPKDVIRLASEAAGAGEALAQGVLACIYAFEGDWADPVAAEKWARRAAGEANCLGQYVLGWLYMKGVVVEKSDVTAWAYLDFARRRMREFRADDASPLLQAVEQRMSGEERQQAKQLQQTWLRDWRLQSS